MAVVQPHYIEVKKLIRRSQLPDSYFLGKYSFSPYRACQHGCTYCDGRAEKYYVEGDFERDIIIRQNTILLLEKELATLREPGPIMIGSGISDAYQPIEGREKLMRRSAEILAETDFPVTILTKSKLIRRDIDLWQRVNERGGFTLMMTLSLLDDTVRRRFEPLAGSVPARLNTLRRFKERGITVGVAAMPFLPFITDRPDDIACLADTLAEIGIDFVLVGGLTLRPGRQKERYFQTVQQYYPELKPHYRELYGENRPSGAPRRQHQHAFFEMVEQTFAERQLPTRIPHRIFRGRFAVYDEVFLLLQHLESLYARRGVDVTRLINSRKFYTDWLLDEKTLFNRRRRLSYQALEDKLRQMIQLGDLARLLKNHKLADFLKAVISERQTLDYLTLRLQ